MAGPSGPEPLFHFGVFELDLRAGELRKRGIRIKIQEQPLQILGLLIECPGEVVTREQIQKKLWNGDTFVDFDNAINSAVRKMRDALGDTSENPRFVETVARHGYRFIAPVTQHLTARASRAGETTRAARTARAGSRRIRSRLDPPAAERDQRAKRWICSGRVRFVDRRRRRGLAGGPHARAGTLVRRNAGRAG